MSNTDPNSNEKSIKNQGKALLKSLAKAEAKAHGKVRGKDLKQKIKSLTPQQRELLLKKLNIGKTAELESDSTEGDISKIQLSFAQERQWFLDRLSPENPVYNITGALRLQGRLNMAALTATFTEILNRHEILRAYVTEDMGRPILKISQSSKVRIEKIDLASFPQLEVEEEWRKAYREELLRGFDLSVAPWMRVTLITLNTSEWILLLSFHHIASDGWSIGVVMKEFKALYSAYSESRPPDIVALPIQYPDFARQQRERMERGAFEASLAYWRDQLKESPTNTELQADRLVHSTDIKGEENFRAGSFKRVLDGKLRHRLEEISKEESVTLFTTMLTAFKSLLALCLDRSDIVVGSPISGRSSVESEELVGLFLNTLALRSELPHELTFREALRIVQQTVLNALEHGEAPFDQVLQVIDAKKNGDQPPLFQTLFNFTPSPPKSMVLPELRASFEEPPVVHSELPIRLYITPDDFELSLTLVYQTHLYSEARMECFIDQYLSILEQIAFEPSRVLNTLNLTLKNESSTLPDPTAEIEEPEFPPLGDTILQWAKRDPELPAIVHGGITLTYGEFAQRVENLVSKLSDCGLQPGEAVAVYGPRSPGVVVGMAAILKIGGNLLTLSQDLPEARRFENLQAAKVRFLLAVREQDSDDWIDSVDDWHIIHISQGGESEDHEENQDLQQCVVDIPRSDLNKRGPTPCYTFFTSGSTGKPKGVLGSASGLSHWLFWQSSTFSIGPGDRCGQLTGLSFDVVLRDVFLPLVSGATLVIPEKEDIASGFTTLQFLDREKISILHTVPTIAQSWLGDSSLDVSLEYLRQIFFAGEALTSTLVTNWRKRFPKSGAIVNLYGPTETTLAKCFYCVPDIPRKGVQPLGQALPQTQALILSPNRKQCGIGQPGEIVLRTPFRSLGYLDLPEQNRRRFIVNPFRDDPSDLLYLTGDRGMICADSMIESLGRLDDQVKLRGVRVEPNEVQATLQSHSDIAECAVVVRQSSEDVDPYLVAYVVLVPDSEPNVSRLRDHAARSLPVVMVPAVFVFLESLPMTSNHKLDRSRLPEPDHSRPILEHQFVEPRNPVEFVILSIWEELLEIRPIGVKDDFFDLGGHSLLAWQLLARIERELGKKLSLATLFEGPTIEQLAAADYEISSKRAVPLWPGENEFKIFLIHPGGGMLWSYFPLLKEMQSPVPVIGLQARGLDSDTLPSENLKEIAEEYLEEIIQIQPKGPYFLGGHSMGGVIGYEVAQMLVERGESVAELIMMDSSASGQNDSEGFSQLTEPQERIAHSLVEMVSALGRFVDDENLGLSFEDLSQLSAADQIDMVVEKLARIESITFRPNANELHRLLRVNEALIKASRSYCPKPSLVPITLIRAKDSIPLVGDESLGWSAYTKSPINIAYVTGDHMTMMSQSNVSELAKIVRDKINEAISSWSNP